MSGLEILKKNGFSPEEIANIWYYFFILSGCQDVEILRIDYDSELQFKLAIIETFSKFSFLYDFKISEENSFTDIYNKMMKVHPEYLIREYYLATGEGYYLLEEDREYNLYDDTQDPYNPYDREDYWDWAWTLLSDEYGEF